MLVTFIRRLGSGPNEHPHLNSFVIDGNLRQWPAGRSSLTAPLATTVNLFPHVFDNLGVLVLGAE